MTANTNPTSPDCPGVTANTHISTQPTLTSPDCPWVTANTHISRLPPGDSQHPHLQTAPGWQPNTHISRLNQIPKIQGGQDTCAVVFQSILTFSPNNRHHQHFFPKISKADQKGNREDNGRTLSLKIHPFLSFSLSLQTLWLYIYIHNVKTFKH